MSPTAQGTPVVFLRVVLLLAVLLCPGVASGQTGEAVFEAAHIEHAGTVAEVDHRITSLSERANPAVKEFGDNFDSYLQRWQAAIQNAIESE